MRFLVFTLFLFSTSSLANDIKIMSDDSYAVTMYACEAETKNIEFCYCAIEVFIDIILDNKSTLNRFGDIETPPMVDLNDVINQIMRNQIFCRNNGY